MLLVTLTPDFPPDPGFLTPPEPFLSVPFCNALSLKQKHEKIIMKYYTNKAYILNLGCFFLVSKKLFYINDDKMYINQNIL